MIRSKSTLPLALFLVAAFAPGRLAAQDDLRKRIGDTGGTRTDVWVYNDIAKAIDRARRENKPIFVTFRCVPCKACAAFDADVANGNERIRQLAKEKFVSVRQVEMKGVDLSLFQFDHDLNWAAMFINADGVVYGRYGTQSAEGPDAYNSIDGLVNAMNRVLELHADYPKNAEQLRGKRPMKRPFKSALQLPGIENPERLAGQTTRRNCVHCHNIHDAENLHAQKTGKFTHDMLWRYPLPQNIGLEIDGKSGIRIDKVVKDSPAAKAGIEPGEDVVRINGQPIVSIADMQWVLHHASNEDTQVVVETSKSGRHVVTLALGWKKYDASWRASMWALSPKLRVWTPAVSAEERKKLGINEEDSALLVKWINQDSPGGRSALKSGLREGDIIVEAAGKPIRSTPTQFNMYLKLTYKVGDELPLVVLRNGERRNIRVRLVE